MLAEWSGVKLPRYNNSLVYVLAKGNSLHSTRAAGMITTFHTPLLFHSLLLPTFLQRSVTLKIDTCSFASFKSTRPAYDLPRNTKRPAFDIDIDIRPTHPANRADRWLPYWN
jgi:hypothetical protein